MATSPESDEMRAEYDFRSLRGVQRGRYAGRRTGGVRVVRLADDVAAAFMDDEAVNKVLREYLRGKVAAGD